MARASLRFTAEVAVILAGAGLVAYHKLKPPEPAPAAESAAPAVDLAMPRSAQPRPPEAASAMLVIPERAEPVPRLRNSRLRTPAPRPLGGTPQLFAQAPQADVPSGRAHRFRRRAAALFSREVLLWAGAAVCCCLLACFFILMRALRRGPGQRDYTLH